MAEDISTNINHASLICQLKSRCAKTCMVLYSEYQSLLSEIKGLFFFFFNLKFVVSFFLPENKKLIKSVVYLTGQCQSSG